MSDDAARRRADYIRALKEEREGYARMGRSERVAEVDAELARFDQAPKGRTSARKAKAD